MDSYQAIYDATRSRIGSCDVGSAVERAAMQAFDMGNMRAILQEAFCIAADSMARPSVLYRPAVYPDGDMWCALYGATLHDGVAGFGATPAEAMADFDQNWLKQRCPAAAKPAA